MNATERIRLAERIRDLEGLSDDERASLLALLHETKTYGLVWEDKPEEVEERLREEFPVLVEDKSKALTKGGPDAPNHILIEGDNLEALTTLAYTHAGKIDVIYIDPPYNTGKEFIYNDNIVDSDDAYKHSKWLSFMSKRLRIAYCLLKPNGVIFISIDFHEQASLQMLCNEIFKESNFIAHTTVKGNPRGRQSSQYFAQVDDSLLIYRKSTATELQGLAISDETSKKRFNKVDSYGRPFEEWELRKRGADSRRIDSPNLWYPIYYNSILETLSLQRTSSEDIEITPKLSSGEDGRWRWGKEKFQREKSSLYARLTRNGYNVFERKYPESKSRQLAPTIWDFAEVNTELGTKLLKEVLGREVPFEYPKPIGLITTILELFPNKNSIVLDFFAGSGTTLHAVMQLNAEDGGKRQCILCTNNENGICEKVTYERNKRVINGYTKPNGDKVPGLHNNNLRYYSTAFVPRERTQKNRRELMNKSTDLLCIKENLYSEKNAFGKIKLNPKGARFFDDDKKKMLVIYYPEFIPFFVEEIAEMELEEPIKVYVYSPGKYAFDDEFAPVIDKVNLCALPQSIIDAMLRVMPEKTPDKTLVAASPAVEKDGVSVNLFNSSDFKQQ